MIAAVIANLAFTLERERREILAEAQVTSQNLLRVIEEQARGAVEATDLSLASLARALPLLPGRSEPRNKDINSLLLADLRHLPFVRALWVLDADGNIVHDSENLPGNFNLAAREYFQVHRSDPAVGMYLGAPLLSALKVWFVPASRRIDNPDGSFGGVVVAAIEPRSFEELFKTISVGKDGVVGLARPDGTLIARVPVVEKWRGVKPDPLPTFVERLARGDSSTLRTPSRLDGVDRVLSYRKLKDRELVVFLGLSVEHVLASWRRQAIASIVSATGLIATLLFMSFVAVRALSRREASEARYRELWRVALESHRNLSAAQRLTRLGSWEFEIVSPDGLEDEVRLSQEALRIFGYSSADIPVTRERVRLSIHPEDRPKLVQAQQEAIASNSAYAMDFRIRRADGSERVVRSRAAVEAGSVPLKIIGTVHDITEQALKDAALSEAKNRLAALSDQLLRVQEEERASLARDLHDEFGQLLTALKLQLQTLAQRSPSPRLEDSIALVEHALTQVRELTRNLRPSQLDDFGLAVALRSHIDRLAKPHGCAVSFDCRADFPRVSGPVATAFFRIAQEGVNNAIRHAKAGEIKVTLSRYDGALGLTIIDDGVGFDTQLMHANAVRGHSLGLLSMEERAHLVGGGVTIASTKGRGTMIEARAPLETSTEVAA